MAQQNLGAAKTSACYSIAPFLGVAMSIIILKGKHKLSFYIALIIMIISTIIMIQDNIALQHTHEHRHGDLVRTHPHSRTHSHTHIHLDEHDEHSHKITDLDNHNHTHE